MAAFGREWQGKRERRKELSQICFLHPEVYVAQTTAAHINHFYKAVMEANAYPGPAVINVYTTCQPEHGVPDCMSAQQAAVKHALFRCSFTIHARGENSSASSWSATPLKKKTGGAPKRDKLVTFIDFAHTEGRLPGNSTKTETSSMLLQAEESGYELANAARVGRPALTTTRETMAASKIILFLGFLPGALRALDYALCWHARVKEKWYSECCAR
jgi:hypothetical protein